MEKKLRKGQKIIRLQDEAKIKEYLADGYVLVGEKGAVVVPEEKSEETKLFEEMNAGEQIAFIENIENEEELLALKDKTKKATALKAIDMKIKALKG